MKRSARAAAVIAASLLAAACTHGGRDWVEFDNVDPDGWAYIDALAFVPERVDSTAPGRLRLALRHDSEYPYSNLWLKIEYTDRGRPVADTLNITLADLYGRWLGSGFGATRRMEVDVADNVVLANGEPVVVRHIMRVDTLRGIDRVGVSLIAQP